MIAEDVKATLRTLAQQTGSITSAARHLGVSQQYYSAILANQRGLSAKILRALKLRRVVSYEPETTADRPVHRRTRS